MERTKISTCLSPAEQPRLRPCLTIVRIAILAHCRKPQVDSANSTNILLKRKRGKQLKRQIALHRDKKATCIVHENRIPCIVYPFARSHFWVRTSETFNCITERHVHQSCELYTLQVTNVPHRGSVIPCISSII